MGVCLVSDARVLGCLALYAAEALVFEPDDVNAAGVFVHHAAAALAAARVINQVETAAASRHESGLAQGSLMNRYGLAEAGSFEVLRRYSSSTNTKLRKVARDVVASGELPTVEQRPLSCATRRCQRR